MTFDDAFTKLVGIEGGYTVDAGGPTRWGVTEAVARRHGYAGDMREYPQDEAKKVYATDYWAPLFCDQLPPAMQYPVFDAAVNSGVGQATDWLQAALGVRRDGIIGPVTLAALGAADQHRFVRRFCGLRLMFMTALKNWDEDGRGWSRRIATLLVE